MSPLEFIVSGTPRSFRSGSRNSWGSRVRSSAIGALPPGLGAVDESVHVTVIYFYVETALDLDNILKPILDALNGVVYDDDYQVTNLTAAKIDLTGTLNIAGAPKAIVDRLTSKGGLEADFVYVRVEPARMGVVP